MVAEVANCHVSFLLHGPIIPPIAILDNSQLHKLPVTVEVTSNLAMSFGHYAFGVEIASQRHVAVYRKPTAFQGKTQLP